MEDMVENKFLLTIGIPTYNRGPYLARLLKRLSAEVESLPASIRKLICFVISDNDSTDDTEDIINDFKGKISCHLIHNKNHINLGPCKNIAYVYDCSDSDYVWVIGDDDLIELGSLAPIINLLMEESPDLIYLQNYWYLTESEILLNTNKIQFGFKNLSLKDFVKKSNLMLTFISAVIAKSSVGRRYRAYMLSTDLVQLSWILPLLTPGNKFLIMSPVIIYAQGGNSGGYGIIQVFAHNLIDILENIVPVEEWISRIFINASLANHFPEFALNSRFKNYEFKDKRFEHDLDEIFINNWRYWVFVKPLFHLSESGAKIYFRLTKLIYKKFSKFII